jgi:hypothetical protein
MDKFKNMIFAYSKIIFLPICINQDFCKKCLKLYFLFTFLN